MLEDSLAIESEESYICHRDIMSPRIWAMLTSARYRGNEHAMMPIQTPPSSRLKNKNGSVGEKAIVVMCAARLNIAASIMVIRRPRRLFNISALHHPMPILPICGALSAISTRYSDVTGSLNRTDLSIKNKLVLEWQDKQLRLLYCCKEASTCPLSKETVSVFDSSC